MKMEQTECSETSEYKIQTPGNNPEESTKHSEHDESLKSRIFYMSFFLNLLGCFLFILKLVRCYITHETYRGPLNKLAT